MPIEKRVDEECFLIIGRGQVHPLEHRILAVGGLDPIGLSASCRVPLETNQIGLIDNIEPIHRLGFSAACILGDLVGLKHALEHSSKIELFGYRVPTGFGNHLSCDALAGVPANNRFWQTVDRYS